MAIEMTEARMRDEILHLQALVDLMRETVEKERRLHEETYKKSAARQEFFDWLVAAYPEIVEQYELTRKLIKLAEPLPKISR